MGIHHLHFFEAITNTAKVYDFSESEAYSKLPDGQTATINSSSNTYYRMTAANFSVNKDVMNDVSHFCDFHRLCQDRFM